MFHSARLKLTAWYLAIIMLVSLSFSAVIYRVLTNEVDRFARNQRLRIERWLNQDENFPSDFRFRPPLHEMPIIDLEMVNDIKRRIILSLFAVNGAIFILSGGFGYILAGRTLAPIKNMLDEQSRFITDASHELRTPITALRTEMEVALRDKKLTVLDARQLLKGNLQEVINLQSLSDNLIKLTQYSDSYSGVSFAKISILDIVDEAVKKVSIMAKHKKIIIENKVEDKNIEAEKQSLMELFIILLDNAIKYSPKGKTIKLISKADSKNLNVEVVDKGIGIAEEDVENIFNRFYRSDKSRIKDEVGGFGLGLSIAKEITDRHNGAITVKSKMGEGSTFKVSLPIRQQHRVTS